MPELAGSRRGLQTPVSARDAPQDRRSCLAALPPPLYNSISAHAVCAWERIFQTNVFFAALRANLRTVANTTLSRNDDTGKTLQASATLRVCTFPPLPSLLP